MLQGSTVTIETTSVTAPSVALRGAYEFNAPKKEIVAIVRTLERIADHKSIMPALRHILIKVDGECVSLAATNLNTYGTVDVFSWVTGGSGDFMVDAKELATALRGMPDALINFCALNGRLELEAKNVKTSVATLPGRDAPKYPRFDKDLFATVDSGVLLDAIKTVAPTICEDETRFHLNGVFLKLDGSALTTVSTDGHRLTKCERDLFQTGSARFQPSGLILCADSVKHSIALLKGCRNDVVEVAHKGLQLALRNATKGVTTTFYGKCIDAKFPDYAQVIPNNDGVIVEANRDELIAALKRAEGVLGKRAVWGTSIYVEAGLMYLKTARDGKTAHESMCVSRGPGGSPMVGVNPTYLREALEVLEGVTVVLTIGKSAPGKSTLDPLKVNRSQDRSTLIVVMPMRID